LIIYATYILVRQKVKRKMRLLEKQIAVDAERQRISTDMHDEIGSGITRIALMSELMQIKQRTKSDLMDEIKSISTSAHKLVETMSEIIWALNPQNDTLENLLAYIREQSQQHFEPFDLQFDIDFPEEVPYVKLSNQERRNLFLATKELLNNALKHSEATVISLSFYVNRNQLCFSVSDNGIGINQQKIREGSNGIRNLRKRMNDINGSIEWIPLNPGTLVNYTMTLNANTTISTFVGVF
ncbi:MAG: histidine kinase, partial [Ginsengibacter sp.]